MAGSEGKTQCSPAIFAGKENCRTGNRQPGRHFLPGTQGLVGNLCRGERLQFAGLSGRRGQIRLTLVADQFDQFTDRYLKLETGAMLVRHAKTRGGWSFQPATLRLEHYSDSAVSSGSESGAGRLYSFSLLRKVRRLTPSSLAAWVRLPWQ
jgi:hypothetical protein